MSPATQSRISADDGRPPAAHLVVKRGHRGRYRFALITNQGRLAGEVMVEHGSGRDDAISKIESLARSLSAALADGTQPERLDPSSDNNATC